MENSKEKNITKKKIIKARNYIGPVIFKLSSKNKNFDFIKFFKENAKSKTQNNSINKENKIKNKGDSLISNSKRKPTKILISNFINNSKNKEDKTIKKALVLPNQTCINTSNYQRSNKYQTKSNSSNFEYVNTEISMAKATPNKSPYISEYHAKYNKTNQKKSKTIKNWYNNENNKLNEFQKFLNNNKVTNEKEFNNKNEEYKGSKNDENNLYHKLENIKIKCHHLLNIFSIISIHLANEVEKYKNEI